MKKRFIVTEAQLKEYVEKKQAEKTFYDIIVSLHMNQKYLKENVSVENANQTVIDDYRRKNLITPKVNEMLIKFKILNERGQII